MAEIKIVNPEALGKPLGQYSHLTRVKASEFIFIAGQVGVDGLGRATAMVGITARYRFGRRSLGVGSIRAIGAT